MLTSARLFSVGLLLLGTAVSAAEPAASPAPVQDVDVIRSICYADQGAKKLLADLYRPREYQQDLPVVLMIHGGAWFSGNKVHVTQHARQAAQAGYAVLAINYRLAPTYKFPAQVSDCLAALRWIRDNAAEYHLDLDRVAAYGYSAGGHLACLLGTTFRDVREGAEGEEDLPVVRAVVAGGSPCEFSWIPEDSNALAYWLGASREEAPDVYRAASPAIHVDPLDPPVFFFHGSSDRVVPLSSPQRMVRALTANGVDAELYLVEQAGHLEAFLREEPRRRSISFLNAHFRTAADAR